ncbi:MAG: hypothetical protein H7Z75_05125 [Ferruginibacter sp.]|nr:hypothetical protein [Cytophagales bacterium]
MSASGGDRTFAASPTKTMVMDSSIKTFNASSTLLFITVLLAGFYGGTGFFVVLGGNPAIQKMSAATFAEYWQHTDFYMAARMKFFGPLLLLCLVGSTALLYFQNNFISCGLMFAALVVLTADLFVIFNFNHPLNRLIQSWDLN